MRYMHQIEVTDRPEDPVWGVLVRSEPEEYDFGTAADYGREVLRVWIDDHYARGEDEPPVLADEYGNPALRVRVAFAGDDEAFGDGHDLARVTSGDLNAEVDPELAAVDAAREAVLYAGLWHRQALKLLGGNLEAARYGGHGANALAERAAPAVSRPVALRMMPNVPVRVIWSVIRGESPGSSVVEPGAWSIEIPGVILDWAEGHGLSKDDPDVWLGVALDSDAGEVAGEIANRSGAVSEADGQAITEGLEQP